eukprot:11723838-Ditylum_brightwellii.AAC.1
MKVPELIGKVVECDPVADHIHDIPPFNFSYVASILMAKSSNNQGTSLWGIEVYTRKVVVDGSPNEFEVPVYKHFTRKDAANIPNKQSHCLKNLIFIQGFQRAFLGKYCQNVVWGLMDVVLWLELGKVAISEGSWMGLQPMSVEVAYFRPPDTGVWVATGKSWNFAPFDVEFYIIGGSSQAMIGRLPADD